MTLCDLCKKWLIPLCAAGGCFYIGMAVQAQLTPPPPAYQAQAEASFTLQDRKILMRINNNVDACKAYTRSIWAKFNPYKIEQKILDSPAEQE